MKKNSNKKIMAVKILLGIVVVVLIYGISWISICGIIKLITILLGLTFKWKIATVIWLVICILRSIFSTTVNSK